MTKVPVPERDEFLDPLLRAMHSLGGSGAVREIHDEVVRIMRLTDKQLEVLYNPGKSNRTAVADRLAWARSDLKKYGLMDITRRGVWALTPKGRETIEVVPSDVRRGLRELQKKEKAQSELTNPSTSFPADETKFDITETDNSLNWREELLEILRKTDPSAFERLFQLILRESGFTKVDVTQASHDGGIDGKGILQINDFLSFRVVFQCKRYSGSVGPDVVQKLRGAMPGSADRGLIVTTGHFTQGAIKEASHEHKSPIELVDGEELLNRLKALELGVSTEMVEQVTVDPDFFANI